MYIYDSFISTKLPTPLISLPQQRQSCRTHPSSLCSVSLACSTYSCRSDATCVLVRSSFFTAISIDRSLFLVDIDENTGCPLNVSHACAKCARDQNRWGCYCELDSNDELITASIFTPCPTGAIERTAKRVSRRRNSLR